jgi:hypothetical protein
MTFGTKTKEMVKKRIKIEYYIKVEVIKNQFKRLVNE